MANEKECTCHKFIRLHDGHCDVHGFVRKQEVDAEEAAGYPKSVGEIPPERIFCTVHLYLTEENQVAGGVDYKGNVLGALEVPDEVGQECHVAAEHLLRYTRKAIDHASVEVDLLGRLMEAFGITEDDLDESNEQQQGSGPAAESTGEQSTASVPRDN